MGDKNLVETTPMAEELNLPGPIENGGDNKGLVASVKEKLGSLFQIKESDSRRKALGDITGGVIQAVTTSEKLRDINVGENSATLNVAKDWDEYVQQGLASYNFVTENTQASSIGTVTDFLKLQQNLNAYLHVITYNGTMEDLQNFKSLNNDVLTNSVDWENLKLDKMSTEEREAFLPYAPTEHILAILESDVHIDPYILMDTVHYHEGTCIADYIKTSSCFDGDLLDKFYGNIGIITQYPSERLFNDILEYMETRQMRPFYDINGEDGLVSFETLLEIVSHKSTTIPQETRERAKKYLLDYIQGRFDISEKSGPLYYCPPMSQLQNYIEKRKGGLSIHLPELKNMFTEFLNEHNLTEILREEDRDIIDFLDSIS